MVAGCSRPAKKHRLSTNAGERDPALAEHWNEKAYPIDLGWPRDSWTLRFRVRGLFLSHLDSGRYLVGRCLGYATDFRPNLRAHRLGHAAHPAES